LYFLLPFLYLIVYILCSLSSNSLILSILLVKSILSSFLDSLVVKCHTSIGWKPSTHFIHLLSLIFVFNLRNENINGTKVISEYLKTAIITANHAIIKAGIAAISAQILGAREVNRVYHIHHHMIIIVNCLRLNPNTIGSSFSI
jgi:hypothetical protein